MLPHARVSSRRGYDLNGPVVMAPFRRSKLGEFPSQPEINRSCQWVHRHHSRPSRPSLGVVVKWWVAAPSGPEKLDDEEPRRSGKTTTITHLMHKRHRITYESASEVESNLCSYNTYIIKNVFFRTGEDQLVVVIFDREERRVQSAKSPHLSLVLTPGPAAAPPDGTNEARLSTLPHRIIVIQAPAAGTPGAVGPTRCARAIIPSAAITRAVCTALGPRDPYFDTVRAYCK
ncbi:hypothetical protein EVAR_102159_1 [Eumeta japonica]|uniref:Uncharacterized protein n=1 Tax=Eumeta variegata TaxID=151549 RepID=A0A4C1U047_EUMVA|nr:hypothetical protein EVAR_102159_1 [Eumeta japonica]